MQQIVVKIIGPAVRIRTRLALPRAGRGLVMSEMRAGGG
jgi:hypothetical protein